MPISYADALTKDGCKSNLKVRLAASQPVTQPEPPPKKGPNLFERMGSPKYVMAPMVQGSELPFRMLCRRYGTQLCYTPMWDAARMVSEPPYAAAVIKDASCKADRYEGFREVPLVLRDKGHLGRPPAGGGGGGGSWSRKGWWRGGGGPERALPRGGCISNRPGHPPRHFPRHAFPCKCFTDAH